MSRASLTRAVEFSAGHRYHRPEWSEAENRDRFGELAEPPGHGHNYRVEVRVEGEIDPETGMVVDLTELDGILRRQVEERFDHAFLNDLSDFAGETSIPTTENVARVVWERVAPRLPEGARLERVRVREERDLWADYEGG